MANKYYTIELTEKQLYHIHDALNAYSYDIDSEKLPGKMQLHNSTVKALDNHEVSSRRQMLSYLLK